MSETMATGLILVVCLYPFVLIMYALLKNEGAPKKKFVFRGEADQGTAKNSRGGANL